jgi:hypothetical protein
MMRGVHAGAVVALAVLWLLAGATAFPQGRMIDGLTMLGEGHRYVDPSGNALDLMAFHSKYHEKIVGMHFSSAGKPSLHFYMNAVIWDRLKQQLIKARDHWQTLRPTTFKSVGAVKGYRVKNHLVTMSLGVQGATYLAPKQLFLTATGGAHKQERIFVYFSEAELQSLVNDFSTIDSLLGGSAGR